jgi:hypothetical protein
MLAANGLTGFYYCLVLLGIGSLPIGGAWLAPSLLVLGVVNIASLIAIWKWRLWGLYALVACAVVMFFVNITVGIALWRAAIGLIGPLLMFVVMKPLWKQYKWVRLTTRSSGP